MTLKSFLTASTVALAMTAIPHATFAQTPQSSQPAAQPRPTPPPDQTAPPTSTNPDPTQQPTTTAPQPPTTTAPQPPTTTAPQPPTTTAPQPPTTTAPQPPTTTAPQPPTVGTSGTVTPSPADLPHTASPLPLMMLLACAAFAGAGLVRFASGRV